MAPFHMIRVALQALSLVFGSIGIFALYFSIYIPMVTPVGVLLLIAAVAMVYAMQQLS
jgi:hypothetical protein